MPAWRKIEAALVEVARHYGFELDQGIDTGDKLVTDLGEANEINLTDFAKELEKRL